LEADMTRKWTARGGLVVAAAFALAPWLAGADKKPAAKLTTLDGKVVPLADVVKKAGGQLDSDASPTSLVLVAEGGKVYPLVKDAGSRLFFKDKSLLNRPVRLTGKLVPGGQLLMVRLVRSLVKGKPHDVYYWCDICAIRRGEKEICECCGGPMELKEEPVKK
jgi:hypothetical protein